MFRHPAPRLTVAACLFVGLGCGPAEPGPDRVTVGFWEAVHEGDYEAARGYSDGPAPGEIERAFGNRPFDSVHVADTLEGDTSARVETELRGEDGVLAFDTRLERGPQGWRVAVAGTAEEVRRETFSAAFGELDDALREGRQLIGEALERGAREASKALRRAQEEIDEAYPPLPESGETP